MSVHLKRRCHEAIVIDGVGHRSLFEPDTNLTRFRCEAISGTVQGSTHAGFHSLGLEPEDVDRSELSFGSLIESTGEWVGLFSSSEIGSGLRDGSRFLIAADYFGFGKIHYAIVPSKSSPGARTLIASSSFRGVLRALDQLDIEPTLRWDVAVPHIISNVNLFRTRTSRRTFADEVEVLSAKEVLLVSRDGISISRRPLPTYTSNYENLLDEGISAAIADAQIAARRDGPNSISLSGGKDSRALFSMLCAGGVEKDWNVVTKRPGGQASASTEIFRKDLKYASMIVDRYQLDWRCEVTGDYVDVDFTEFINDHQDFRSNQSFEVAPLTRLRRNTNESTMMGIGGELLRSYIARGYRDGNPNWWSNAGKSKESAGRDLHSLFSRLALPWNLPDDLYRSATARFAEGMMFDIDGTVLDHIDESYGEYRSRAFSANMESNRLSGTYLAYPLARPQFVAASHLLSEEDRDDGRVLFDVIERCEPELNALPFAAPPWPLRFKTRGTSSTWSSVSVDRAESKYRQQHGAGVPPRVVRRSVENEDFRRDAWTAVAAGTEYLRDLGPSDWVDRLIMRAARRAMFSDKSCYALSAVIGTLIDVASPEPVDITVLSVDLGRDSLTSVEGRELRSSVVSRFGAGFKRDLSTRRAQDSMFGRVAEQLDLTSVTAELTLNDPDTECSTTVTLKGLPAKAEVAVYLYEAGSCISRTKYQSTPALQFKDVGRERRPDRATVFLRWEGDPDALRVFDIGVA